MEQDNTDTETRKNNSSCIRCCGPVCLSTSHDALWVFSFGSEDVWPEHSGQVLATHLVTAGVTLDVI